jgi:hypothetical protein
MAVRWWFVEVLPDTLSQQKRCTIVTGWGKTRASWQTSDIQAAVLALLKQHGIPAEVQPDNPGRLRLTLRKQDFSAFDQS